MNKPLDVNVISLFINSVYCATQISCSVYFTRLVACHIFSGAKRIFFPTRCSNRLGVCVSVCSGSFAGLDVIFDAATIYAVLVKHANAAQFVLKVLFCSIAMRELYICIKAAIWYINISSSLDYCFNKQNCVLSISSLSIAAMTGRFNLLTDWLTDFRLLKRDKTHAVQFAIGLIQT